MHHPSHHQHCEPAGFCLDYAPPLISNYALHNTFFKALLLQLTLILCNIAEKGDSAG